MPRRGRIFDIFLSSPQNGLQTERKHALDEVERLSKEFANESAALTLNLLRWEDIPGGGIGATQQQDVVDRALSFHYDLYVGMMWNRFGSGKVDKAGSGTELEFDRALARRQSGDTGIDIVFFFREDEPEGGWVDIERQKIHDFRKKLDAAKVLPNTYRGAEQFRDLFSRTIRKLAQDAMRTSRSADSLELKLRVLGETCAWIVMDLGKEVAAATAANPTLNFGQVMQQSKQRVAVCNNRLPHIYAALEGEVRDLASDCILDKAERLNIHADTALRVQKRVREIEGIVGGLVGALEQESIKHERYAEAMTRCRDVIEEAQGRLKSWNQQLKAILDVVDQLRTMRSTN